jgi:hypothetical protein
MEEHLSVLMQMFEQMSRQGTRKGVPQTSERKKSDRRCGKNFSQLHRSIMMFKGCLSETHHSVRYLQSYINEYTNRFNRHKMKEDDAARAYSRT